MREAIEMNWNYELMTRLLEWRLQEMIEEKRDKLQELVEGRERGILLYRSGFLAIYGITLGKRTIREIATLGSLKKYLPYETCISAVQRAAERLECEDIKIERKGDRLFFYFTAEGLRRFL
ncbi:MAG: hypothetical protein DRP01_01425 [Archaeoglobales archaeon]|nr:MAG: hypothetical protein DRP01_01425 [Archaeoglobales archaeon]